MASVVAGSADPGRFVPELVEHARAGRFPFDRLPTGDPRHDITTAGADSTSGVAVKPVLLVPRPVSARGPGGLAVSS